MLTYYFDNRGNKTKTEFLYDCIKADILTGQISPGEKLPSKRILAEHLGISVITVENAYNMLEEEGYITAKPRSGFYAARLPQSVERHITRQKVIYMKGNLAEDSMTEGSLDENGLPEDTLAEDDLSESESFFPVKGMTKLMRRILSEQPDIMLRKSPNAGCAVLRNTISGFLKRFRNLDVRPSHIIIGSGAEYLYGQIVQLLGRDIIYGIEYPSYEKIEKVYLTNGARIEHLKMGSDGIETGALAATKAKLLHVTPFHSYPTGVTASAGKRFEYLAWAEEHDGYLLEDDYDSEFAFFKKPIETLFSMDRHNRVIYMNTFSKSIAPGMRIAYMILPDDLMDRYRQYLGFYSCTVPVFDQYVLAAFIENGGFERHLNRIRKYKF